MFPRSRDPVQLWTRTSRTTECRQPAPGRAFRGNRVLNRAQRSGGAAGVRAVPARPACILKAAFVREDARSPGLESCPVAQVTASGRDSRARLRPPRGPPLPARSLPASTNKKGPLCAPLRRSVRGVRGGEVFLDSRARGKQRAVLFRTLPLAERRPAAGPPSPPPAAHWGTVPLLGRPASAAAGHRDPVCRAGCLLGAEQ